jgi:uncharacterized membrane-anchored protein YjiN (DUF445 family)
VTSCWRTSATTSCTTRCGGRLEARLGEAVSFFVNTYGSELAEVISVTVERWDGKEAAERIELHVGRDLQFIRINGTIVGALAGLVIHALSLALG